MTATLPQEMQSHTYPLMYEVEGSHWWFVGRRLILESFLRQIAEKFKQEKVNVKDTFNSLQDEDNGSLQILDVGCGTGANLEMLAKFGAATGVDVSEDALEFCRKRGLERVKQGLAEDLPFNSESFDLVTALDVVEHLDDDLAGLREMCRVLQKNGRALIFVPAFMFLWGVQDDVSNHRRRYTKKQIVAQLEKASFEIERVTYANLTFFAPVFLGRTLMKITGFRPESENNLTLTSINGFLGQLFGAERHFLRFTNFPFGVSIVVVARKV